MPTNKRGAGAKAPKKSAVEQRKTNYTRKLKDGDLVKTEKGYEKFKKNTRGAGAKATKGKSK